MGKQRRPIKAPAPTPTITQEEEIQEEEEDEVIQSENSIVTPIIAIVIGLLLAGFLSSLSNPSLITLESPGEERLVLSLLQTESETGKITNKIKELETLEYNVKIDRLLDQAEYYYGIAEARNALPLLEEIESLNPKDSDTLMSLQVGFVAGHMNAGNWEKAGNHLIEAFRISKYLPNYVCTVLGIWNATAGSVDHQYREELKGHIVSFFDALDMNTFGRDRYFTCVNVLLSIAATNHMPYESIYAFTRLHENAYGESYKAYTAQRLSMLYDHLDDYASYLEYRQKAFQQAATHYAFGDSVRSSDDQSARVLVLLEPELHSVDYISIHKRAIPSRPVPDRSLFDSITNHVLSASSSLSVPSNWPRNYDFERNIEFTAIPDITTVIEGLYVHKQDFIFAPDFSSVSSLISDQQRLPTFIFSEEATFITHHYMDYRKVMLENAAIISDLMDIGFFEQKNDASINIAQYNKLEIFKQLFMQMGVSTQIFRDFGNGRSIRETNVIAYEFPKDTDIPYKAIHTTLSPASSIRSLRDKLVASPLPASERDMIIWVHNPTSGYEIYDEELIKRFTGEFGTKFTVSRSTGLERNLFSTRKLFQRAKVIVGLINEGLVSAIYAAEGTCIIGIPNYNPQDTIVIDNMAVALNQPLFLVEEMTTSPYDHLSVTSEQIDILLTAVRQVLEAQEAAQ